MLALLRKTIAPAQLKPQYENVILSRVDMYEQAFTSSTVDPVHNYEIYEHLGDASANKFLAWYFYRRFPQLNCPKGVKVLARLKINYASKRSFFKIAEKLGFWPFIRASSAEKEINRKSLLEDVLEAFIGLTEMLLDEYFIVGVGFAVVYDILKSIFDEMYISLKYEDLVDPKSRLKELFDANPQLGTIVYKHSRQYTAVFVKTLAGVQTKIGEAHGSDKKDRQQDAAKMGLEKLKLEGVVPKDENQDYNLICE